MSIHTPESNGIFRHILYSYRIGRKKTAMKMTVEDGDREKQAMKWLISQTSVSQSQMDALTHISRWRAIGLRRAHQSDIEGAEKVMHVARSKLDLVGLPQLAYLFGNTFQLAAEAYIDYRLHEYEEANKKMQWSLEINNQLVKLGCTPLEPRRVHLCRNKVRVDAFAQRYDAAMSLAAKELSYLMGNYVNGNFKADLNRQLLNEMTREERWALCYQLFKEVALILTKVDDATGSKLLTILISEFGSLDKLEDEQFVFEPALKWLRLKQTYYFDSRDRYLEAAADFIKEGEGEWPVLWQAVRFDMYNSCQSLDHPEAYELQQIIRRDVMNSTDLPKPLQPA